jgi:hypothetical protein
MWHTWKGEKRVQGFGGKARRKKTTWKTTRRWEDGLKMDPREIGWGCVEWIHLAQVREHWQALVKAVMNVWILAPCSC